MLFWNVVVPIFAGLVEEATMLFSPTSWIADSNSCPCAAGSLADGEESVGALLLDAGEEVLVLGAPLLADLPAAAGAATVIVVGGLDAFCPTNFPPKKATATAATRHASAMMIPG